MIRAVVAGLLLGACGLAPGSGASPLAVGEGSWGSEPLAEDDECLSGTCGVSALQLRARPAAGEAPERQGESEDRRRRRRRRRDGRRREPNHAFKRPTWGWRPTKVDPPHEQPTQCNGTSLIKGHQGCCGGSVVDFATQACCGQIVYNHAQLSCCSHGNGWATIYHPYSQNCCDDPAVRNRNGGLCSIQKGEISCCNRAAETHRRRRRRRRGNLHAHAHTGEDWGAEGEGDGNDDDDDDEDEDDDDDGADEDEVEEGAGGKQAQPGGGAKPSGQRAQ